MNNLIQSILFIFFIHSTINLNAQKFDKKIIELATNYESERGNQDEIE